MNLKIIKLAYHRNGIDGAPFHVTVLNDGEGIKLAVLFEAERHCAVFDFEKLLTGNILFGENSYRGDRYEAPLRQAIKQHDPKEGVITADASIPDRVERCRKALNGYSDDDRLLRLIDLLADAMHWSLANGENFHYALCVAGKHYLAELSDE